VNTTCDDAPETVAPIRSGDTAGSWRAEELTAAIKGLAVGARGGIMAPFVELQQTRHGIRL
jgi:hypothetical protein